MLINIFIDFFYFTKLPIKSTNMFIRSTLRVQGAAIDISPFFVTFWSYHGYRRFRN